MTDVNLRQLDREALTDHVTAYLQSLGKDFWRLLWRAVRELAAGKPVEPERLAALANLPLDRTLARRVGSGTQPVSGWSGPG